MKYPIERLVGNGEKCQRKVNINGNWYSHTDLDDIHEKFCVYMEYINHSTRFAGRTTKRYQPKSDLGWYTPFMIPFHCDWNWLLSVIEKLDKPEITMTITKLDIGLTWELVARELGAIK